MKRLRSALILMGLLTAATLTEVYAVNGGFFGGASLGWIGGNDWEDLLDTGGYSNSRHSNLFYGAFLEFGFGRFAFRPELIVLTPSGRAEGTPGIVRVDSRVLNIPLLFCGKYPLRYGSLYGIIGPSINLFLKDITTEVENPGSTSKFSETPYYGMVLGIMLGLGYEIPLGPLRVITDLRYHRTLTDILKERDTNFQNVIILMGASLPIP